MQNFLLSYDTTPSCTIQCNAIQYPWTLSIPNHILKIDSFRTDAKNSVNFVSSLLSSFSTYICQDKKAVTVYYQRNFLVGRFDNLIVLQTTYSIDMKSCNWKSWMHVYKDLESHPPKNGCKSCPENMHLLTWHLKSISVTHSCNSKCAHQQPTVTTL